MAVVAAGEDIFAGGEEETDKPDVRENGNFQENHLDFFLLDLQK